MLVFLILFIGVPVLELALLIKIGRHLGLWATLGLIVMTGALGAWLARRQGLSALRRVQEELAGGRIPRDSILDGVLILLAAVLLVTPGVLTDVFGFLCLIPGTRALVRRYLIRRFRHAAQNGRVRMSMHFDGSFRPDEAPDGNRTERPSAEREGRRASESGRIIDVKPLEDRD